MRPAIAVALDNGHGAADTGANLPEIGAQMHYVILAEHSAEVCPTANAKTKALMLEMGPQIPQVAEKNGVKIVSGPWVNHDHISVMVVEADRVESLETFLSQIRLSQWNTVRVLLSQSIDEGMKDVVEGTPLF
jgi:hypothetical protein